MKVIHYIHHAPYSGCWWERGYYAWNGRFGKDERIFPIHMPGNQYPLKRIHETFLSETQDDLWGIDGFEEYEWDDTLHKVISPTRWPEFCTFADEHGLDFLWQCDYCGGNVSGMLFGDWSEMAGYRGNGGVGVEVDGWLCEECRSLGEIWHAVVWQNQGQVEICNGFGELMGTETFNPETEDGFAIAAEILREHGNGDEIISGNEEAGQ